MLACTRAPPAESPPTYAATSTVYPTPSAIHTLPATSAPTGARTQAPTDAPPVAPTYTPSLAPTDAPTVAPTEAPTLAPTEGPDGTITSADGMLLVTVPMGAGVDPATITIEAVPAAETPQEVTVAGDRIVPGSAYRL